MPWDIVQHLPNANDIHGLFDQYSMTKAEGLEADLNEDAPDDFMWRESGEAIGLHMLLKALLIVDALPHGTGPDETPTVRTEDVRQFYRGVARNTSMTHLELSGCERCFSDLLPLFRRNSLRRLHLSIMTLDAGSARDIAAALSSFDGLRTFSMGPADDEDFEDEYATQIVGALIGHSNLVELSLKGFRGRGWINQLANVITQNPGPSLEELELSENGWRTMEELLCDRSSINAIHASNHTLNELGCVSIRFKNLSPGRAHELGAYLKLNNNSNKSRVARKKIIRYHFVNGSQNMRSLHTVKLELVPRIMGWMCSGRDGLELSYMFVKAMSFIFESVSDTRSSVAIGAGGLKRKRSGSSSN